MSQTPLMVQYYKIKKENPDTILLFRVGDFFETFEDDAKLASKVLGITLTKRSNGAAGDTPLAGFPHHALDNYLPKLVRAGYRVAVCEQVEDPKKAKGIVKREVIEVVTPGVVFSDKILDHKKNNYLMAMYFSGELCGLSFCDVSTGEFYLFETNSNDIKSAVELVNPSEILVQKKNKDFFFDIIKSTGSEARIQKVDDWIFNLEYAKEKLVSQFNTASIKGFGIEGKNHGIIAAGAVVNYLQETQKANLSHIKKISLFNVSNYMILDAATKRNLEIIYSMNDFSKEGSLFGVVDKTFTPMGGRLLKKWLSAPLKKLDPVNDRLNAVESLFNDKITLDAISSFLSEIGDLERLISKVCTGRVNPREISALKTSLEKIPLIKTVLADSNSPVLQKISTNLKGLEHIISKITTGLTDNPPLSLSDGGVIRAGYSPELDDLREIKFEGDSWLKKLQNNERERTGISSLKIMFNRVFGYYIEISNANKDKIPNDYIRKQTLVNAERYITPELKEFEEKILNAEDNIAKLEFELFNDIRFYIASETESIQKNAGIIGMLDCLTSFAICAIENNYVKPEVLVGYALEVLESRHPVVEKILPPGEKFTTNDYKLDQEENRIIILTGPNMAGKSVYLRQLGLIVLLAQSGSFVPAKSAKIPLTDRIFTRVGASDNITAGESTFLVEMHEAANILNNATPKSLVLLDEIGRGTSTFDGLSIAWAITEFLHESKDCAAKTIFATHYHELNELAEIYPGIQNYRVQVRETGDKVIFLHKVSEGSADHSYGIQVARMAGLPVWVTNRAKEILSNLEGKELTPYETKQQKKKKVKNDTGFYEVSLFEFKDEELRKEISDINLDNITPIEALNKLDRLKKKVKEDK